MMGFLDGLLAFGRPKPTFVLVFLMLTITLGRVASNDQTEVPATGLLCISECSTCPVICSSSPPPPKESSYPPSSPPVHHSPPPQFYYHSPPPPETPKWTPPPSPSWLMYPPTPPPPFKYNNNPPPSPVQARPPPTAGTGPINNYPYPYYYFYASEASPLSSRASFSVLVFLCFVVLLCYS